MMKKRNHIWGLLIMFAGIGSLLFLCMEMLSRKKKYGVIELGRSR